MKEFLEAGKIINTHGIHGEVKLEPWSDTPDFLKNFSTVYIDGQPKKLLHVRVYKQFTYLQLEGVESAAAAMALRDKEVCIRREDANLPGDRWFIQDMVGMDVFDLRQKRVIGRLDGVLELPGGRLFSIAHEKILIPDRPEFFRGVDEERQQVLVETIPGMGDEGENA